MTSATDELRKLLNERGVEYWVAQGLTFWNCDYERECVAYEYQVEDMPKLAMNPPKCSACGYEPSIYECSWFGDDGYEYEGYFCSNCGAMVV